MGKRYYPMKFRSDGEGWDEWPPYDEPNLDFSGIWEVGLHEAEAAAIKAGDEHYKATRKTQEEYIKNGRKERGYYY